MHRFTEALSFGEFTHCILYVMTRLLVLVMVLCSLVEASGLSASSARSRCPEQEEMVSLQQIQSVEHNRMKRLLLLDQMKTLASRARFEGRGFANHHFRWLYTSKTSMRKCLLRSGRVVSMFEDCLQSIKPREVASKYFESSIVEMFHSDQVNVSSVLDFGSGSGDYLRRHFQLGTKVAVGIETEFLGEVGWYAQGWNFSAGPIQFAKRIPEDAEEFEKLKCLVFETPVKKFDLVQTLEVFEHIPRELHCILLNFLTSQANSFVVASISALGQKGIGHISNRDQRDFMEEWRKRGFVEDITLTRLLQQKVGQWAPWLRKNTIVYRLVSPKLVDCEHETDWHLYENKEQRQCFYKSSGHISRRQCPV